MSDYYGNAPEGRRIVYHLSDEQIEERSQEALEDHDRQEPEEPEEDDD